MSLRPTCPVIQVPRAGATARNLGLATFFFSALGLASFGCGKHSDSPAPTPLPTEAQHEVLDSLATSYPGLFGSWDLKDSAQSWGDLGSDVLHLEITATEMIYEKNGHMAQEDLAFNAGTARYVGNCHYRIHATEFGASAGNGATVPHLAAYPDRVALIEDAGNHADCSEQVERLQHLNEKYHALRYVSGIDAVGIGNDELSLIPGFGFRARSRYGRRP